MYGRKPQLLPSGPMSPADLGRSAGKKNPDAAEAADKPGKYIPQSRVDELNRSAVGLGAQCFYYGAPAAPFKTRWDPRGGEKHVLIKDTDEAIISNYEKDFASAANDAAALEAVARSYAHGKAPPGGFQKDVAKQMENRESAPLPKHGDETTRTRIFPMDDDGRPQEKEAGVSKGGAGASQSQKDRAKFRSLDFTLLSDEKPFRPFRKPHENSDVFGPSQIKWESHG